MPEINYIEKVREILSKREGEHKAYVHTYGCQQNFSDGEKLEGLLEEMGYEIINSAEEAEFVIFNTCAIRENAEKRVFGNVGILKKAHEENPDMIIAVCGCMVQQEHIAKKFRQSYPFVDIVFGTHAAPRLPELVYKHITAKKRQFDIGEGEGCMAEYLPIHRDSDMKANLPIMHGCDNFCTYCVVPLVRGREKSREPENILAEAREIVAAGYKEITLLGQNVNSYGKGLVKGITFAELLREVNAIPGDFRIKFMTSHPKDCTRELLEAIRDCEKVCNYIHLPVQSGSNDVLRRMNRRYTAEHYMELVDMAREIIPYVTITSDLIVGFPGETEEDFEATMELSRKARWSMTYSFIYSKREGTKAAVMEDQIPHDVSSNRFQRLLDLQTEISHEINASFVGKTTTVLFDDEVDVGEGYISGRSYENLVVRAPRTDVQKGLAKVYLKESLGWALDGEIIKTEE
ncbi:MAG: tRNA (N6-isopentenyl adenosine(37)-C2)-methylthiotransferase MiaB [Oscillospiraceae bacterium]|nr:tRNA (N6-isopentenyl adenosine(37)-C2)-methylthiotransferase MiaB [Oscillospiraceae bacterium]MBQ8595634.1 tRNA (N6-isopentenyl adenosine(37)-C2)-methylthiotransferase MiaB [Oscillospiraceae bacterium]